MGRRQSWRRSERSASNSSCHELLELRMSLDIFPKKWDVPQIDETHPNSYFQRNGMFPKLTKHIRIPLEIYPKSSRTSNFSLVDLGTHPLALSVGRLPGRFQSPLKAHEPLDRNHAGVPVTRCGTLGASKTADRRPTAAADRRQRHPTAAADRRHPTAAADRLSGQGIACGRRCRASLAPTAAPSTPGAHTSTRAKCSKTERSWNRPRNVLSARIRCGQTKSSRR